MKTKKLIGKVLDFFDLSKKAQKREIDRLIELRKDLKEKRKKISKKLKSAEKWEKEHLLAELKAIENLRTKTKEALKQLEEK